VRSHPVTNVTTASVSENHTLPPAESNLQDNVLLLSKEPVIHDREPVVSDKKPAVVSANTWSLDANYDSLFGSDNSDNVALSNPVTNVTATLRSQKSTSASPVDSLDLVLFDDSQPPTDGQSNNSNALSTGSPPFPLPALDQSAPVTGVPQQKPGI
jgi:hypothetical protein